MTSIDYSCVIVLLFNNINKQTNPVSNNKIERLKIEFSLLLIYENSLVRV